MIEESQLEEFVAWREAKSRSEVDLSPRAYLAELENEANRRRIEDAVNILASLTNTYPSDMEEPDLARHTLDTAQNAFRALTEGVRYEIDRQLNGKTTVIYT